MKVLAQNFKKSLQVERRSNTSKLIHYTRSYFLYSYHLHIYLPNTIHILCESYTKKTIYILLRIVSTRDMCNALKDHVAKVEENIHRGELCT